MVGTGLHTFARWLATFALGGLVAASGTVMHRAYAPWGVALCLGLVLVSAVAARAWSGLVGLLLYGIAWVVVVQVLSLTGPGGDVLVPAGQKIGYVWIIGGMLMVAVAAFAPRSWFEGELTAPGHDGRLDPAAAERTGTDPAADGAAATDSAAPDSAVIDADA